MTTTDPKKALAAVHARLLAGQDEARQAMHQSGGHGRAAARAVLAALADSAGGDRQACQAAIADLAAAQDDARSAWKQGGAHARATARLALDALADLQGISWDHPAPPPPPPPPPPPEGVVTVAAGPGDVRVSATAPTLVHASLRREGDASLAAACAWLYEGLGPVAVGDTAVFRPGDTEAEAAVTIPARPGLTAPVPFRLRLLAPFVGLEPGVPDTADGRLLPPAVTPPSPPPPPPPSPPGKFPLLARVDTHGHPHPSGGCGSSNDADTFAGELDPMATWRGRPFSAFSAFSNRNGDWDALANALGSKGGVFAEVAKRDAALNIATPLFPARHGSDAPFRDLAAGKFDARHLANIRAVKGYGQPAVLAVRLCHEWLSGSQHDSPIHDPSGGEDWARGFARVAGMWTNELGEHCVIDLNSIRRPGIPFMKWIGALKPGVDFHVLSADSYNNAKDGRYVADRKSFDAYADNRGPDGSPWGIRAWFETAKSLGVMTAVPEYGCTTPPGRSAEADQPFYIDAMHDLFVEYSWMFLGDFYFNRVDHATGDHRVFDPQARAACASNPKSAAAYRARYAR